MWKISQQESVEGKKKIQIEPFPPGRTRGLSRFVSMYLSSQPVLPSQVTDRRLGTAAVGVLVTCRVWGVVCELTLVRSGPVELSSSSDFDWTWPALREAFEGGVPCSDPQLEVPAWPSPGDLVWRSVPKSSFGCSDDQTRRCVWIRLRYRHHRYYLHGILCIPSAWGAFKPQFILWCGKAFLRGI